MKKFIAALLAFAAFICSAESVYDVLPMNATLSSITQAYGVPEKTGEYCLIGDAMLAFYESGRLQAKGRLYENVADVACITEGRFDAATKLKQGAPLSKLTELLGEGTELMYINIADEDEPGVRRVLAWKDIDGTVLEALVELDDGEWKLFAITEIMANS